MNEAMSRREFLRAGGKKAYGPFCYLAKLFGIAFVSWLFVLMVEILRGITLQGGMLLLGAIVAIGLLESMRWLADKIYDRFSIRGKALCDALGESMGIFVIVGLGILAWHKMQVKDVATASILLIALFVATLQKGRDHYRRRIGEQSSPPVRLSRDSK